jgi:hypothetical protein
MSPDRADVGRDAIGIELLEPAPEEVDAGADLSLTVRVTSPAGSDLCNAPFLIVAANDVRSSGALPDRAGDNGHIVRIALTAPEEIGEFTWRFVIPERETGGEACREASLPFSFRTRPHATSLAVWDHPSPVVIGARFKLKVGAQCSSACASLQGQEIEIHDETDAVVASAPLSTSPWPETNALYWAEVDLTAPGTAGHHTWTVKFPAAELRLPHGAASFAFSLIVDKPPEHTVTVEVVEEQTATPIDDAHVRLGAYRTFTDQMGLARLAVPDGEHELFIWKVGYNAPARMVDVKGDARVRIEAAILPTVNPDSYWQG